MPARKKQGRKTAAKAREAVAGKAAAKPEARPAVTLREASVQKKAPEKPVFLPAAQPAPVPALAAPSPAAPAPTPPAAQAPEAEAAPGKAIGGKARYAGFLIRLAAWIIDFIAVSIVLVAPTFLFAALGSLRWLFLLVAVLLSYAYFPLFVIVWGTTPGKALFGLRVVDEGLVSPPGIRAALLRELAGRAFLDLFTLGLGNLLIIFDEKKQALHDKIAGTYVVYEKESGIIRRRA